MARIDWCWRIRAGDRRPDTPPAGPAGRVRPQPQLHCHGSWTRISPGQSGLGSPLGCRQHGYRKQQALTASGPARGGDGGNRTRVRKIRFAHAYKLSRPLGLAGWAPVDRAIIRPATPIRGSSFVSCVASGHGIPDLRRLVHCLPGSGFGRRVPNSRGRAQPRRGLGRQGKSLKVSAVGTLVLR
jgi:hypothetical protein